MDEILKKYKSLKTITEKRLYCIEINKKNLNVDLLKYEKLSLFSVNVCFKNITGYDLNDERKDRNIKYKDEKNY